jgi:mono/diheme cytochrome c family protein
VRPLAGISFAAVVSFVGATSLFALQAGHVPLVPAQASAIASLPTPHTGEDIYRVACAACHGPDGRGRSRSDVGFETPLRDLTECAFATVEPSPDWEAVVSRGGPIRSLDRRMPAFGDALSPDDIALVVDYMRGFCTERAKWPQGDLNFPRPFFTEKAFPENEAVWTTVIGTGDDRSVNNTLVYEQRVGPRGQFEVLAPLVFVQNDAGTWKGGVGDVAVAFKRALYASMDTGAIVSAGGELIIPSGDAEAGLGNGFYVYEVFAMYNQMLPRDSYLLFHGGMEVPSDSDEPTEAYLRTSIGTTLASDHGFGRSWSPQVELLWARPSGEASEWDVVPQLQVSLSKLQHVLLAGGLRIPVNQRADRSTQVVVYLLWDWFDGSFFEYWK